MGAKQFFFSQLKSKQYFHPKLSWYENIVQAHEQV